MRKISVTVFIPPNCPIIDPHNVKGWGVYESPKRPPLWAYADDSIQLTPIFGYGCLEDGTYTSIYKSFIFHDDEGWTEFDMHIAVILTFHSDFGLTLHDGSYAYIKNQPAFPGFDERISDYWRVMCKVIPDWEGGQFYIEFDVSRLEDGNHTKSHVMDYEKYKALMVECDRRLAAEAEHKNESDWVAENPDWKFCEANEDDPQQGKTPACQ
jgi:hypothetical protein